ncbi:hypothetical protein A3D77_06150 [Candidatus Gottesmanbacteria bacterium RIFCSPHIGHO2_02_FULL_39_11]|uniref:Uncharacterized protein n=1 Tax=Candidatus Gottesmanbacteria bacterium RIFCSPHIGHO2_02_FULL_39_11 TaxID=1798382 RepID=A0A1F5ZW78_9BACT|nr:MAG: hypothetical protein A3D77_06150 [Candidatus Gottesmanbacteria bacterium RIFCSPHIGHO2_02_FULL_39_11]
MEAQNNTNQAQKSHVFSSRSFKRNNKILLWALSLIVILSVSGLGVYLLSRPKPDFTSNPVPNVINGSLSVTPAVSLKKINYSLPQDWKIIKDSSNTFEVGYNPGTQVAQTTSTGIRIQNTSPTNPNDETPITLSLKSYDGSSERSFLDREIGEKLSSFNIWPGYKEFEYQIHGKNCFFLTGVAISKNPLTWGTCILSPTQALLITTWDSDFESFLPTLKFYIP